MKKLYYTLLSALLFLPLTVAASYLPSPPKLEATGYLLLDFESGQTLAQENADSRLEPASLTKMMTAYAVFKELENGRITLEDEVHVSEKAWRMPGSRMFIEVDSKVPVEKLLKGMIIQSGNDASVALAEFVAGNEEGFVYLMNQYANSLGLNNTHFTNSTGLPDKEHYSTPRDLAQLAAALIREFPQYYKWYSQKKYTYNNIPQYNRNKLLWRDESVDGVKTGHTESAGYCLVSSAKRDDMRLISVVMGTDSEKARARESQKLIDYGFRFYETHRLYSAGDKLKDLRIWKGAVDTVPLGLANDLYVTVPRGLYDKLNASLSVEKVITAPVGKGQQLGNVSVNLEGETIASRPLVALEDVAEGSLVDKLLDSVMMLLE